MLNEDKLALALFLIIGAALYATGGFAFIVGM